VNFLIGQPYAKLTSLLDLNGEASFCAWYSSVQLFCLFIFSAIYSYNESKKNKGYLSLMFLPGLFLLMSIDETVQIHEWLGLKSDMLLAHGSRIGTLFHKSGIWMFLFGLPFAALFFVWLYSVKKQIFENPSAIKKLVIGMVLFLLGALGFETISNFIRKDLLVYEVVLEEGLEMIGATVMFWSVYEMSLKYIPCVFQEEV
jgi:hypothetical protein